MRHGRGSNLCFAEPFRDFSYFASLQCSDFCKYLLEGRSDVSEQHFVFRVTISLYDLCRYFNGLQS